MNLLDLPTDPKEILLAAVAASERAKPRNSKKGIGPSSLGGCRARVWLTLRDAPKTNPTKHMAAWMGTAIHGAIEDGIALLDPFGDRFLREVAVSRDGMSGSCDLFDTATGGVIDWKTTKQKGLRYFPSTDQLWQVQTYGWMLAGAGHDVRTVTLVGIARDGDEDTVKVHTEPYSEAVALEAQEWLARVKAEERQPAPGKPVVFCRSYCPFYGGACPGL